ncbi:hypothetical protein E2C01_068236 [Portunus trituberculatus]|uniref:Uncharacterized protein n=1 Tax=Portunus trituberculatus TaxID=210409 RepID=A0A5B7HVR2_PORTR|nr:hypothetical protein [Portunus trituberculatus]
MREDLGCAQHARATQQLCSITSQCRYVGPHYSREDKAEEATVERVGNITMPRKNRRKSWWHGDYVMGQWTISFFLQDIIKSAHTSFPDSSCRELEVRAHDIRGIATSMLMWKNCSVLTILGVACWRTQLVFADH